MLTLAGDIVSLEVLLLTSDTVTPPGGAGLPNVTGNATDCVGPTEMFDGRPITPGFSTLTLAVVSGINGTALTWTTVLPAATPVTGRRAVEFVPPGKNVTC